MNTKEKARWIARLAVVPILAVTACRGGEDMQDGYETGLLEAVEVEPLGDSAYLVVRDVWVTLADEPEAHMHRARADFQANEWNAASRELDRAAALFKWGRHYALGHEEREAFSATAEELTETAHFIREGSEFGLEPLDRVLAKGYRVLAEHHAGLALEEWEAGRHVGVAILLRAAATEVETGFALSHEGSDPSIEAAITGARSVADRLETTSPPVEADVRGAIRELRVAARGLGEVLGSRRH